MSRDPTTDESSLPSVFQMQWQANPDPAALPFPRDAPPFPLTAIDWQQLSLTDAEFTPHSWENLQQLISANRLEDLKRWPSALKAYLAWTAHVKERYGSVLAYLLDQRLRWEPLEDETGALRFHVRNAVPFADPSDFRILRNDWSYAFEPGIRHFVVWLKQRLPVDEKGALSEDGRAMVEAFVKSEFCNGGREVEPESRVLWFKNTTDLQSDPQTMADLIRDSAFGHCVRLVTGRKYLQYPEEKDPEIWKKYVSHEKSGHAAYHGDTEAPENRNEIDALTQAHGVRSREQGDNSETSSRTMGEGVNEASGVMVDPEKGMDIHVVDWYGPDDPQNPKNWSRAKRYFVTFEIVLLTFSVYIGSAIYTPGLRGVMQEFGVAQVPATLGLTLYVAGYGLGPLIWSPMSEIPQIGRLWVYIGTLLIFVLLQLPTVFAVNIGMLFAFRFLTGFFGSPALATGGASIADMYRPKKQVYGLAVWGIGAVCGPVLGPLVGGFAVMARGWTWTIWELMWLSGFCLVFLFFFFPETSSTNILHRRTARLRKLTGDDRLTCEADMMAAQMTPKDIVFTSLVKPITLNFTEPIVFLLNLYIALIYGLLYIWFESFPLVFTEIYGFNLGLEGVAFLGILVGTLISVVALFSWNYWYLEKQFDENGNVEPEKRLIPAMVGSFFVPICLFWFGWSSRPDVHWIVPIIGSSFFGIASFTLFQAVLPYLSDAYPTSVASVLAGNDLMRSSFGAGFPLFANAMFKNLGIAWASSTLAFLGVAFIPIPFALYKWGRQIRQRSKNARKDI
ncbi:MFS general substrate transporter [Decorospora gaudefroyi]|uniref:MFS general substrate transporter n=1 Tax=Decorospora gaudefroyi TaxID=184978 RepID=A0A6A5KN33_9PLEO|nr:MFS general substrate transporter [Decorospora gaudefroyi]